MDSSDDTAQKLFRLYQSHASPPSASGAPAAARPTSPAARPTSPAAADESKKTTKQPPMQPAGSKSPAPAAKAGVGSKVDSRPTSPDRALSPTKKKKWIFF